MEFSDRAAICMRVIQKILILLGTASVIFVLVNLCKANYWREFLDLYLKIQRNPNDDWAYYNRAVVRRECGDNQGALADFTQVIKINPDNANAYYQRGRLHVREENTQQAIADFNKAADIYWKKGDDYRYKYTLDEIQRTQQQ